ncbi:thioredoxin family protein [Tenacibaculum sp. M341]|uniref:thioredoxin family protein n=1 Tax=Tenacibaculum sp. M341 TaxID=2530339 RepID=UPI00104FA105|nr:thioredoxin family protein [Tenacibaculum sp. M341]TCI84385.1 thioredoxin family protein [Tenacibaculum sp. M341]
MNRIGLFVIVIVAFISNSFAQETANHVIWEPTFKEALEKAKSEQKPILIYFTGSDWCGPCIQLDKELFHTEKFETFAKEKMVVYMADFPRNRDLITSDARKINKELSKKYKQTSFPTMVIIDAKGNVLGQKNGKYMAEYYYPFFEEVVRAFE